MTDKGMASRAHLRICRATCHKMQPPRPSRLPQRVQAAGGAAGGLPRAHWEAGALFPLFPLLESGGSGHESNAGSSGPWELVRHLAARGPATRVGS